MPKFVAQKDQIVPGSFLADMAGKVAEIEPREELRRLVLDPLIHPAWPGRSLLHAREWIVVYHLHNAGCFSKFRSRMTAIQKIGRRKMAMALPAMAWFGLAWALPDGSAPASFRSGRNHS